MCIQNKGNMSEDFLHWNSYTKNEFYKWFLSGILNYFDLTLTPFI